MIGCSASLASFGYARLRRDGFDKLTASRSLRFPDMLGTTPVRDAKWRLR